MKIQIQLIVHKHDWLDVNASVNFLHKTLIVVCFAFEELNQNPQNIHVTDGKGLGHE